MDKTAKRIAVLGGGPCGLAAAWRLARKGHKVVLFEEKPTIGGLGAGIVINGNIYEYGPHIFHTNDAEIMNDINSIVGDELFTVKKPILIKFKGSYFSYPLTARDVISKLPIRTIVRAGLSFLYWNLKYLVFRPKEETSETVLIRNYGKVLYEIFFKSYIEHVWGISPAGFSPRFAKQRIPRLSAFSAIFNIVSRLHALTQHRVSTSDFVENMEGNIYSTKKGFSVIAERMGREITRLGSEIRTSSKVTGVERKTSGIFSISIAQHHDALEFDGVISTIPINDLARMVTPSLSKDTQEAASRLRFMPLIFVGILVSKPRVLPASIMYFRELSFNRITDLSYFGVHTKPEGSTILIAEITCSGPDGIRPDEKLSAKTVIKELIDEELITEDMVLEYHTFGYEDAYPIYTLGFEDDLDKVIKNLSSYAALETTGRQGLFRYVNIHIAMKMAYEAADSLDTKLKDGQKTDDKK